MKKVFKRLVAMALATVMVVSTLTVVAADEWTWTQGTLSEELKFGDVNNDGAVTSEDVLELLKLITGIYSMKTMHYNSADINKDEKVSVRDGLLLLQNIAKLRDDGLGYENNLKDITYYVPESFKEGNEMLTSEKPLAFYGADGYGKYTTGGRGGRVIYVTNLNDSGEGSFRAAAEASGKRIIVFRVSGVIYLNSTLRVQGDCTIAGETAPGDGITVANAGIQLRGDNIIMRYISSRPGDQKGDQPDGIDVKAISDAIVDHCSTSSAVDENLSIAAGSDSDGNQTVCNRVSVQWCVISESITHSPNNGKRHGMGSIITSGFDGKISYHHNFLSNNSSRNPVIGTITTDKTDPLGTNFELANNVVYNWLGGNASKTAAPNTSEDKGGDSSYVNSEGSFIHRSINRINILNSYYKEGPDSDAGSNFLSEGGMGTTMYFTGNMMNGVMPEDQFSMIDFTNDVLQHDDNPYFTDHGEYLTKDNYWITERFDDTVLTHLQSAETAKDDILKYVGNSRSRDTFDTAYMEQFENGTGGLVDQIFESAGWIYGTPEVNVGTEYYKFVQANYPKRASYPAYTDTDMDGMSDAWEDFMGLNKNDAADGAASYNGSEYTNLDVFLQFLVENPDAAIAK